MRENAKALQTLARWIERVARKEVERLSARCASYELAGTPIPRWVRAGMDERFRRVQQVEARLQMLLGIFAAQGVLPLEFKPAHTVADLLVQHLDALEQDASEKGGMQQVLAAHFAKVYKVALSLATMPMLPAA